MLFGLNWIGHFSDRSVRGQDLLADDFVGDRWRRIYVCKLCSIGVSGGPQLGSERQSNQLLRRQGYCDFFCRLPDSLFQQNDVCASKAKRKGSIESPLLATSMTLCTPSGYHKGALTKYVCEHIHLGSICANARLCGSFLMAKEMRSGRTPFPATTPRSIR